MNNFSLERYIHILVLLVLFVKQSRLDFWLILNKWVFLYLGSRFLNILLFSYGFFRISCFCVFKYFRPQLLNLHDSLQRVLSILSFVQKIDNWRILIKDNDVYWSFLVWDYQLLWIVAFKKPVDLGIAFDLRQGLLFHFFTLKVFLDKIIKKI